MTEQVENSQPGDQESPGKKEEATPQVEEGTPPQAKKEGNVSSLPSHTTAKNDNLSEQPPSKTNVIEQVSNRKPRPDYPGKIIRQCIKKSFKEEELRTLCQFDFIEVYRELRESDRFPEIIDRLIAYCERHGEFEALWSCIKEQTGHYDEFYPQWQEADREYKEWQKSLEAAKGGGWREQYNYEPVSTTQPNAESQLHPLTGDNLPAINDWFFNQLNSQEQSMVLTVALFEGINRKYMMMLSREIEQRFFNPAEVEQ